MHFAPDTDDILEFNVALANTDASGSRSNVDELTTIDELRELLAAHKFSGRIDYDPQELAQVRGVRDELRRIWVLDRDAMVSAVNALFSQISVQPQLVRHDGLDWHLHATPDEAPLVDRLRVEIALALVDVIRVNEVDRLRVCAADDCEGLLVDLSRNRSKRFCSVRCGNRMNMVAYRERQTQIS